MARRLAELAHPFLEHARRHHLRMRRSPRRDRVRPSTPNSLTKLARRPPSTTTQRRRRHGLLQHSSSDPSCELGRAQQASGHQVLSFNWWQGERHLWTAKPVRTPPTSRAIACARSAPPSGSRPSTRWAPRRRRCPMPSLFRTRAEGDRLGRGAVARGYNSKLFEVTKYVTKTGHISLITGLVTSAKCSIRFRPTSRRSCARKRSGPETWRPTARATSWQRSKRASRRPA